jgi:hypothetical protein
MTTNLVTNPQHWRDRAEKARLHAQRMIEPVSKGMMVEVAEHYESLARRAGQRLLQSEKSRAQSSSAF